MEIRSRRGVLKNAVTAAAAAFYGISGRRLSAQEMPLVKKDATARPGASNHAPLPFTSVVSYGNLLFVAGIGCPFEESIEEQTKWVIDQIEKNLTAAGSSLDKVLKVNVYLEDIKSYERMNAVYKTRNWGKVFPARNTISPAALPGTDRGLAMDCVAYL